jgi:hypothetical protein
MKIEHSFVGHSKNIYIVMYKRNADLNEICYT